MFCFSLSDFINEILLTKESNKYENNYKNSGGDRNSN